MTERFYSPVIKYTTNTLKTLPGAKLYFYENNTTTPKSTWADPDRTTENAHPVVALSDGTFPPIFINGSYRAELKSASGVTQPGWPVDDVGAPTVGSPFAEWSATYSYSEGDIVVYNGEVYISDDDDNLGNNPSSSPASWTKKLLIDAPSAESYLNGNSDGTYDWRTIAQTKTDLSLPTDTATELINRATSIDNITDLRLARTATNGQKFNVTSYNSGWAASAKPPVGGGMFTYVSSDTTSAEDYGHIIVGADGKRYYRDNVTNVSLHDFGAIGDGSNEDTAIGRAIDKFLSFGGGYGDQYPEENQLPLYIPSGHFKVSTFTEIAFTGTGQTIIGDGEASRLDGIGIDFTQVRCGVRDILLSGSGDYGIRADGTSNNVRDGWITNVRIRDKDYNIRLYANNANLIFTGCTSEKAVFDGLRGDDCYNFIAQGCYFQRNGRYGVSILKGGEYKFNGCTMSSNDDIGLFVNAADASNQTVEQYFTDCTITLNQLDTTTRDTFAITGTASNGSGGTTVTIGSHTLVEDMLLVVITGTTSYNGSYTIFNVTNTTFDIAVAFVSNQTGTCTRPEWDAYIFASTTLGHVNDFFFTGGNINYLFMGRCYNMNFDNTRLKQQVWLQSGCNRVFIVGNARGRRGSTYKDVVVSGQNTGWARLMYSDNSGATAAGSGRAVLRVPKNTVSLVGNVPPSDGYNDFIVTETDIKLTSGSTTLTIDSNGTHGTGFYSEKTPTSIADDGVYSFTPPVTAGIFILTNTTGQNTRGMMTYFNTSTPTFSDGGFLGSAAARTTGALTGTTGADTFVTCSAHTDGKIYIENRSGGAQTFRWLII